MAYSPKGTTDYAARIAPNDWLELLKDADAVAQRFGSPSIEVPHVQIAQREREAQHASV